MTFTDIDINAQKMLDALTEEHAVLVANRQFDAAAAIFRFTRDADTVTLARLAEFIRAA